MKSSLVKVAALTAAVALAACSNKETKDTAKVVKPTMAPTPVVVTPEPKVDMTAVLEEASTVYFDFDKAEVKAEFADRLAVHVAYLKENTGAMVSLQGHADERGTREYNLALGEQRALAVQNYLVSMGVNASQLNSVSFGEEQKAVENAMTEAEHAENRRVVIMYKSY